MVLGRSMDEYRRKLSSSREDPRVSRREISTSPKHNSASSGIAETNWQSQQNSVYNQALQTSYQHLQLTQPTMYNDQTQYQAQAYPAAYAAYQNYGSSTYNYAAYGQAQPGYVGVPSGNLQPGPPQGYPQGGWAPVGGYVNAPVQADSKTHQHTSSDTSQMDGVAEELKQQRAELIKQREEYERRITVLRRELELLRRQKQELMHDDTTDRDTDLILRENSKLQVEIQNKLKDAINVIEILTGIIGDDAKVPKPEDAARKERLSSATRRSQSVDRGSDTRYNYVHYDPELHWCRMCDVFPKTAKDLLVHQHSKEHRDMMQAENIEIPWHKLPPEPEYPFTEGAAKKRLPIKGLQFFVSATAWYCRLCDSWIGDLHCASQHLKSMKHSENYSNFVEQNPHWEIEWLKDREEALGRVNKGRSSDSDDDKKKKRHKDKLSPPAVAGKDKKKKKRSKKRRKHSSDSSSSSSSSGSSSDEEKKDTSKSIHVAMRNKMKLQAIMNEDLEGKWEALGRLVEHKRKESAPPTTTEMGKESETEDTLINQWMTVKQPFDKDKVLLDNLKDRLKQKQEAEKIKYAEMERRRREKAKQEQELQEKLEREAREKAEQKQKEREDLERLKEIREQIKFRTKDKHYRKKKTPSKSPEYKRRQSRSPSPERRRRSPDRSYRRHENGKQSSDRGRRSSDRSRRSSDRNSDSPDSKYRKRHDDKDEPSRKDRRAPPPPSYKKLPFIGRMPLFKNKKMEDKVEKEIKKEDYDIPRQTRFQPGNLARAFIPEPEVVCFPKLSSYPPITIPPPPAPIIKAAAPAPPKISESKPPKAPPPPKINDKVKEPQPVQEPEKSDLEHFQENIVMMEDDNDDPLKNYQEPFGLLMSSSYPYGNVDYSAMYPPNPPNIYDYTQDVNIDNGDKLTNSVPLSHTMPLQPPPLPPDDPNADLALLGMSSDDLAAQMMK